MGGRANAFLQASLAKILLHRIPRLNHVHPGLNHVTPSLNHVHGSVMVLHGSALGVHGSAVVYGVARSLRVMLVKRH